MTKQDATLQALWTALAPGNAFVVSPARAGLTPGRSVVTEICYISLTGSVVTSVGDLAIDSVAPASACRTPMPTLRDAIRVVNATLVYAFFSAAAQGKSLIISCAGLAVLSSSNAVSFVPVVSSVQNGQARRFVTCVSDCSERHRLAGSSYLSPRSSPRSPETWYRHLDTAICSGPRMRACLKHPHIARADIAAGHLEDIQLGKTQRLRRCISHGIRTQGRRCEGLPTRGIIDYGMSRKELWQTKEEDEKIHFQL